MNHTEAETTKREVNQIRENSEDEYWSKKYGVSSADLKREGNNVGVLDKILKATFKNKSYQL